MFRSRELLKERVTWARELMKDEAEQFLLHAFIDPNPEGHLNTTNVFVWCVNRLALYTWESDAGLVELSFGCPKLQNLVINDCPFSKEAFDVFRCNVPSLRYFQVQGVPRHCRYLLEEAQPNFKQIV
nr:hypothetical protein [Tanacetum cinerariifolium]